MTTGVTYAGADIDTITDAEGAATTFRHTAPFATKVTRPGTPASETTYTSLASSADAYGRIGSVKRKLGSGTVETTTSFDSTYPIEPATVTEDAGGSLARSTTYTYVASSLGLVSRIDAPLDGTYRHYTDLTYNANNDVTQQIESRQGDASLRTTTRYCYSSSTCNTSDADPKLYRVITNYVDGSAGGSNGQVEDVTVTYQVDSYGQRTRETRSNYGGSTLLDSAATGWTYDSLGDQTAEIRDYVSGTVTSPGDDVTPNATTNARTDLTTSFAYDTAGNRVSVADPRRAIESALGTSLSADDYTSRTVFDALGRAVIEQLPTTPSGGDCTPASATCRQSQTTYDELGLVRESRDVPDVVTATIYDKVGRALSTFEDPPPAGGASQTSASTYDAAGRLLTAKDREQVADSSLGQTANTYDELGQAITTVEASGSSVAATTKTVFDALGRVTCEQVGWTSGTCEAAAGTGQTTLTTYDPGDRATIVDDEFTCTKTTVDWRGLATSIVEGYDPGTCSGGTTRTTTNSYDGLGRLTNSALGGDVLEAPTYDSVGNRLSTSATTSSVTTSSAFTLNPLDQVIAEIRSDAGTATSWTKTNYDPAGNATDRCVWNTNPGSEACKAVGGSYTTAPAVNTTTAYDSRDNRVSLKVPGIGETTYDPAHNYAVDKVYVPTKLDGSNQVIAEHLTDYGYDSRHRLTTISESVCAVSAGTHTCSGSAVTTASDSYVYDDNDNRTSVAEFRDGGSAVTTTYCYDALNRLTAAKPTTSCSSSPTETYAYDTAGNRTKVVTDADPPNPPVTVWSGYNAAGQLCKIPATSGTDCSTPNVLDDAAGRIRPGAAGPDLPRRGPPRLGLQGVGLRQRRHGHDALRRRGPAGRARDTALGREHHDHDLPLPGFCHQPGADQRHGEPGIRDRRRRAHRQGLRSLVRLTDDQLSRDLEWPRRCARAVAHQHRRDPYPGQQLQLLELGYPHDHGGVGLLRPQVPLPLRRSRRRAVGRRRARGRPGLHACPPLQPSAGSLPPARPERGRGQPVWVCEQRANEPCRPDRRGDNHGEDYLRVRAGTRVS